MGTEAAAAKDDLGELLAEPSRQIISEEYSVMAPLFTGAVLPC